MVRDYNQGNVKMKIKFYKYLSPFLAPLRLCEKFNGSDVIYLTKPQRHKAPQL